MQRLAWGYTTCFKRVLTGTLSVCLPVLRLPHEQMGPGRRLRYPDFLSVPSIVDILCLSSNSQVIDAPCIPLNCHPHSPVRPTQTRCISSREPGSNCTIAMPYCQLYCYWILVPLIAFRGAHLAGYKPALQYDVTGQLQGRLMRTRVGGSGEAVIT